MKKIAYISVIGTTLMLLSFITFYLLRQVKIKKEKTEPISESVVSYEHFKAIIAESESEFVTLNSEYLDKIKEHNKKFPCFILRLKSTQCDACFDYFITDMKDFLNELGMENCILISWDFHPNDLRKLKSLLNFEIDTLEIESLNIEADKYFQPTLMVVSEKGIISSCYIYKKDLPELNYSAISRLKRELTVGF